MEKNKYQLIDPTWLTDCKAIVAQMSPEEKAVTWFACEEIESKVKPLVREALLKGTIDKFQFVYNNVGYTITVSRGKETSKEVESKVIDYDKAIKFAQEHNFEIPMTPPIPPQVDKEKLETMDWFQNNCEEFVTRKKEIKKTKSYDRIIKKETK